MDNNGFEPREVVFRDNGMPAGWVCSQCLQIYANIVVGLDTEDVARFCCAHPCWTCGAMISHGMMLCPKCRKGDGVHVMKHPYLFRQPEDGTTLTAPDGSIGAIGVPEDEPDSGDLQ